MAVRVSHTNNSSGHDGTYVYRSTSPMDPQNLPAPIADAPPIALGATFEYIDSPADGTYYYRTQDHEGGQVSAVSAEKIIEITPDYAAAQVGEEVGGGIYAGTIAYADARQFHIIAGKQATEAVRAWKAEMTTTAGTEDNDDGLANTNAMLADAVSHPVADYTSGLTVETFSDWYIPSRNEFTLIFNNLASSSHPEFSTNTGDFRWVSNQWPDSTGSAYCHRFNAAGFSTLGKIGTRPVRPIRRVPV